MSNKTRKIVVFAIIALFAGYMLFQYLPHDSGSEIYKETKDETKPSVPLPDFNRDSAYAFVANQVDFGPRTTNTKGNVACRAWLVAKLKSFGADVIEQPFQSKAYTGVLLNGVNIIARYNPGNANRVVLAAHWDTRHIADQDPDPAKRDKPILGADDGGSGVAILLEVARQLQQKPTSIGVDLVLFDAEDYGSDHGESTTWCLGSQYWAANPHVPGYRARFGVLLDMAGARGARFPKEGVSVNFAPQVVDKVWSVATELGYGNYFVPDAASGTTDDHYFVNTIAHIPMVDIINRPLDSPNGSFGEYWHTAHDDMSVIDPNTLKAVGQTMLGVIYQEAALIQ